MTSSALTSMLVAAPVEQVDELQGDLETAGSLGLPDLAEAAPAEAYQHPVAG